GRPARRGAGRGGRGIAQGGGGSAPRTARGGPAAGPGGPPPPPRGPTPPPPPLAGARAEPFPDRRYHAFISNRVEPLALTERDHRRHAQIELATATRKKAQASTTPAPGLLRQRRLAADRLARPQPPPPDRPAPPPRHRP